MSRDRLTRWGLLLNGFGGVLLLICHFPFALPSGESLTLLTSLPTHAEFWQWINSVGSVAGAWATITGIYLQYRAITLPVPVCPPKPPGEQINAAVHSHSPTRMERFNATEFWDAIDFLADCPLPSETHGAYDADVEELIRWARIVRLGTTLNSAVPYRVGNPKPPNWVTQTDDLLNHRRLMSGALYHDRFSMREAEHLLTGIFQAVGADATISSGPESAEGTDAIARVKSVGDAILNVASAAEKYAVDALLYALVRCKTDDGQRSG